MAQGFIDAGQPAISVDTKKKELIGDFANRGRSGRRRGARPRRRARLRREAEGKAIPYGIYDLSNNDGWVNVGTRLTPPSSRSTPSGPGGTT